MGTLEEIRARLKRGSFGYAVGFVLVLAMPAVLLMSLIYPPVIVSQGQAHRIFYTHVPIAWIALYAPLISAVAGVLYLVKRREIFDVWSVANARLAMLCAVCVVISGPLWASTEWGVYWNWKDSRLISFFVLLLSLGGYFLVRNLTEDVNKQGSYAAVMAVLAALAAVLTWFAIRLITPDTHPTSVMGSMSPRIRLTFWASVLGYHLFFLFLLRLSVRHELVKRSMLHLEARG